MCCCFGFWDIITQFLCGNSDVGGTQSNCISLTTTSTTAAAVAATTTQSTKKTLFQIDKNHRFELFRKAPSKCRFLNKIIRYNTARRNAKIAPTKYEQSKQVHLAMH